MRWEKVSWLPLTSLLPERFLTTWPRVHSELVVFSLHVQATVVEIELNKSTRQKSPQTVNQRSCQRPVDSCV